MRKLPLLFLLLIFSLGQSAKLQAQIALNYSDTTLCPGMPLQMCASLSGIQDELDGDDDFSEVIDIGFPFTFFGNTYTKCVASGNAMISFDTTLAGNIYGFTWGLISAPPLFGGTQIVANNAIFAAFSDWYLPAGGSLRYQKYGAVGHRRFIIEWCHIPAFIGSCGQAKVTTQIILYEGSNFIDVQTTEVPPISSGCPSASGGTGAVSYFQQVVQGVRNMNGTAQYFPVDRGPVPSATNWGVTGTMNDGMRFSPNGTNTYNMDAIPYNPWVIIDSLYSPNLKWYAEGAPNLPVGSGACVDVTTNANVNYYVVNYNGLAGCQGDSVNFTDTVHIHFAHPYTYLHQEICAGTSYNWMGQVLFAAGSYDTLLHSVMGCDSTVNLELAINPLPDVSVGGASKLEICDGSATKISLLHPESGAAYQWIKDNAAIPGETSPVYTVNQAGVYKISAISAQGCSATSRPITLAVNPNPDAKILPLPDEVYCTYDTVKLLGQSGENYDYVWSPAAPFRMVTGAEGQQVKGVFGVPETQVVLTVFNQYGCYDSDTANVHTRPCCSVMMPNAFSPNGDGMNDYFNPLLQPAQLLLSFKVYDRYGKLVYNNTDLKHGWNGRYPNGEEANQGVYMYYIKYTCADGKLYERKQDVTLIR